VEASDSPRRHVLGDLIILEEESGTESYEKASLAAKKAAAETCSDPMLLAWRDEAGDRYWPRYECGKGIEPPWIVWASARGADLTVCVGRRWYFYFLCWRETDDPE